MTAKELKHIKKLENEAIALERKCQAKVSELTLYIQSLGYNYVADLCAGLEMNYSYNGDFEDHLVVDPQEMRKGE